MQWRVFYRSRAISQIGRKGRFTMNRKRKIPALVLFALVLSSLSCGQSALLEQRNAQKTQEAIPQQTAAAYEATIAALRKTEQSEATPTPDCVKGIDPMGFEICFEREEVTPTETPDPTLYNSSFTVQSSSQWVNYYDQSKTKLGQVANNTTWFGSEESFVLEGWIPEKYLIFSPTDDGSGTTDCSSHNWGHRGGNSYCHTHIFDEEGKKVLATIPKDMTFTVTGSLSNREVPNKDGTKVLTPGRIVRLEKDVTLNE